MSPRTPLALVGLGASAILLLRRMTSEFDSTGTLSRATVVAMYAAYGTHALLFARVAYRRTFALPMTARPAEAFGTALMLAGVGLWASGIRRFGGAGQVSGTEVGDLVTGGVYRYSRNPQYVGYVLALLGLGLVRRSGGALGLAAAMAVVFRYWVPVEERHLDRALGDAYGRYRERSPRWLSVSPRRMSPMARR